MTANTAYTTCMGDERIFSRRGHFAIFPKFFQGVPKVVKLDCYHSQN